MEDYPTQNITLNYTAMAAAVRSPFVSGFSNPPLSKIPLQFALEGTVQCRNQAFNAQPQPSCYVLCLVEAPAPSCTEGEYLPRFIHPTPHHGEHLQARVNQELEIRVKATATHSKYEGNAYCVTL